MKKIFAFLLSICILLGCTGCGIINQILETRARRRQDLFNLVNEIEKSPDFAMINYTGYLSTSEKIGFSSLVEDKIKEDGKKINESKASFIRYEGDIIEFLYRYKKEKRFFLCTYLVAVNKLLKYLKVK